MIWLTPPLTWKEIIQTAVICGFLLVAGYYLSDSSFIALLGFLVTSGFVVAAQQRGSQPARTSSLLEMDKEQSYALKDDAPITREQVPLSSEEKSTKTTP